MGKEKSPEVLFNRQVNYLLIEKMWEYFHKNEDKEKLYKLLGLDKNIYSRIRTADTYFCVDLEKRWETKNSPLRKIGLSKEIMVGYEPIETEDISLVEWEEYINYRYVDRESNYLRSYSMQCFNKKLKQMFDKLEPDKKTKSDVVKLFYFFKYGRAVTLDMPDAEMVDLRDSLKNVTIDKMKVCDKILRKEVYETLREKYRQLDVIIKYENL